MRSLSKWRERLTLSYYSIVIVCKSWSEFRSRLIRKKSWLRKRRRKKSSCETTHIFSSFPPPKPANLPTPPPTNSSSSPPPSPSPLLDTNWLNSWGGGIVRVNRGLAGKRRRIRILWRKKKGRQIAFPPLRSRCYGRRCRMTCITARHACIYHANYCFFHKRQKLKRKKRHNVFFFF